MQPSTGAAAANPAERAAAWSSSSCSSASSEPSRRQSTRIAGSTSGGQSPESVAIHQGARAWILGAATRYRSVHRSSSVARPGCAPTRTRSAPAPAPRRAHRAQTAPHRVAHRRDGSPTVRKARTMRATSSPKATGVVAGAPGRCANAVSDSTRRPRSTLRTARQLSPWPANLCSKTIGGVTARLAPRPARRPLRRRR